MSLYGGIDLHANKSVVGFINEQDEVLYRKRLSNELSTILEHWVPYQTALQGLVVASTDNWYWLVDGFMAAGYRVPLANPAAMPQYDGLKYTADHSDARWWAHLRRLGVFPEGDLYPQAARAVRDVWRKRAHLVRQPTAHVRSGHNILVRNTGTRFRLKRMRELTQPEREGVLPETAHVLAITSSLAVLDGLRHQIKALEQSVHQRLHPTPAYEQLLTGKGLGPMWAQTITLETGDIHRVPTVGHDAS
jgi:transposase